MFSPGIKKIGLSLVSLLLLAMLPHGSFAQAETKMNDEEKAVADILRKRLQELRGAKDLDINVSKTQFDFYEIVINGQDFAYTNKAVDFILQGRLVDGKTFNDLTAVSEEKFDFVDVKKLPIKNALKIGNGRNVIYTFEDPRCGYCKKLAHDLQDIKDLTIYTFVVGFLGPESNAQAKSIMCHQKSSEVWLDTVLRNNPPASSPTDQKCEGRLNDNNALARKLRISGTPAIIFADGSRFKGYVPKEGIQKKIAEIASAKK